MKIKRILSIILAIILLAIFVSIVWALLKAAFQLFAVLGTALIVVLLISCAFLKFAKPKNKQNPDDVIDGEAKEVK